MEGLVARVDLDYRRFCLIVGCWVDGRFRCSRWFLGALSRGFLLWLCLIAKVVVACDERAMVVFLAGRKSSSVMVDALVGCCCCCCWCWSTPSYPKDKK